MKDDSLGLTGAVGVSSVSSPNKSSYHNATNSCTGLVRSQGGVFGIMHAHKK
jgi:hypothetical protein